MPEGRLFTDPNPDTARAVFAARPRALCDKRMTVAEAVGRFVRDGDYLAIGGFGVNRIPTAVVPRDPSAEEAEPVVRRAYLHTRLSTSAPGNLTDRGQALARVDIAYVIGLEARGLSPHARRVMESGTVEVCEWTNYALAVRLQAAAMGVPFLPSRTMLGTDTLAKSAARR